jgi:excisionase family DNA binding protein
MKADTKDVAAFEAADVGEDVPAAAWRTEQAAKRLNIPYRTLMRMIHDGRLRAVPAGRYYLVPEMEIQAFLNGTQAAS